MHWRVLSQRLSACCFSELTYSKYASVGIVSCLLWDISRCARLLRFFKNVCLPCICCPMKLWSGFLWKLIPQDDCCLDGCLCVENAFQQKLTTSRQGRFLVNVSSDMTLACCSWSVILQDFLFLVMQNYKYNPIYYLIDRFNVWNPFAWIQCHSIYTQFVDKFNQAISPKLINWSEFKLIWVNELEAFEAQLPCFARSDMLWSERRKNK